MRKGHVVRAAQSPANLISRAPGLRREDASNLRPQNGATIPGGQPDHIPIYPEVRVDEDVTEGDDLRPRNLRVAGLQCLGDARRRLADNRELLNYGAAEQLRFLKCRKIFLREEPGNVVRGQALMPYTIAAPLRARTLGSTASARSSIPDPLCSRGGARDPALDRRSPPDRCRHPEETRPACRRRCPPAFLRGRLSQTMRVSGRGTVDRDPPGRSRPPVRFRVEADRKSTR